MKGEELEWYLGRVYVFAQHNHFVVMCMDKNFVQQYNEMPKNW